jgi:hypothetical protein
MKKLNGDLDLHCKQCRAQHEYQGGHSKGDRKEGSQQLHLSTFGCFCFEAGFACEAKGGIDQKTSTAKNSNLCGCGDDLPALGELGRTGRSVQKGRDIVQGTDGATVHSFERIECWTSTTSSTTKRTTKGKPPAIVQTEMG